MWKAADMTSDERVVVGEVERAVDRLHYRLLGPVEVLRDGEFDRSRRAQAAGADGDAVDQRQPGRVDGSVDRRVVGGRRRQGAPERVVGQHLPSAVDARARSRQTQRWHGAGHPAARLRPERRTGPHRCRAVRDASRARAARCSTPIRRRRRWCSARRCRCGAAVPWRSSRSSRSPRPRSPGSTSCD